MFIAFAGFRHSGKDTAADYLARRYGFGRESFARPLKEALRLFCPGVTDEQLFGPSAMRETPIPGLRFSGTCVACGFECALAVGSSTWVCKRCAAEYPDDVTVRIALELLGTEFGRRLSLDLWVASAFSRMESAGGSWAISDARFRNELAYVQARGGKVVRLLRGSRTRNHQSELELESMPLEDFDAVIDNREMTVEELFSSVDGLLAHWT